MKIQLQRTSGEWIETGWESSTPLARVLSDEPRAIAARRVDCFGRVVETRQQTAESPYDDMDWVRYGC